jgi:tyrosine-protein phosphatase
MAKLNSSFAADFRARRTDAPTDSAPNFFELQRPTTPAKKARNLKNLGINTTTSLTNLRAQPPAAPKEKNSSAPPSPLFIKPPTPPRRRPSNLSLTIATPGINDSKPTRLVIPSTPSLNRPALRHFQSSPSLPLCSPCVAPTGGMQLPSLRPIATKTTGLSEVPFEMEEEEDQEPNFDVPQSREEKPAAYPNGPICIYPAGVYLYFEPTAEQAATFDVIVNVASEVQNPFTTPASESQKKLNARRVDGPAAENVDFAALSKQQQPPKTSFDSGSNSPTTPKATPRLQTTQPGEIVLNGQRYRTPEYIHMPWEHNTDIVPDLYKLVKIMDDRVKMGKRVLVHCQCGVSRSASLVVAYGLYKEPEVSVQEAYDKAKKRSKWIGPNMNLIMQLQEFRNGLLRQTQSRSYHDKAFSRRSMGFPTAGPKDPSFERDNDSGSRTPRTAPLPPDNNISMQRASTGNMMAISPGPLSAPSGAFAAGFRRSWDLSQAHFGVPATSTAATPYVDPKGHIVPVVEVADTDLTEEPRLTIDIDAAPRHAPPPTPSTLNFTRQLPLRMQDDSEQNTTLTAPSTLKETHLAPMKPPGFGVLKSPSARSFNIPSIRTEKEDDDEVMSPVKTKFEIPWPREYDEPEQSTSTLKIEAPSAPLKSPRFGGFRLKAFKNLDLDDSHVPPSPSAMSFGFSQTLRAPQQEPSGFSSPLVSQFPKDVFGPPAEEDDDDDDDDNDDVLDEEIKSRRAAEFHMAPLQPRTAVDDPFGLTSPTRYDFSGNSFGRPRSLAQTIDSEDDRRPPSFQAILPPAHQTFNGFASLDGATRSGSPAPFVIQPPTPNHADMVSLADGSSKNIASSSEPQLPSQTAEPLNGQTSPEKPTTPRTVAFLSTPAKTIRTRFSSPNMKQQRELTKLQAEVQTKLAPAAIQHSADDLDALMSPRAEEFTRNPFHFEIRPSSKEGSPTSSNETITDGRNGHSWNEPVRQWTPEKPAIDPRSPAHLGSSPIVRNIWDVL